VLPAAVLIILFIALFSIGYFASRYTPHPLGRLPYDLWSVSWPVKLVLRPLVYTMVAVVIAAILVIGSGIAIWIAFPFVWMTRFFGLEIMLVVLAIVLGGALLLMLKRAVASLTVARPDMAPIQEWAWTGTGPPDWGPFRGFSSGLRWGALMLAALFTLRWALPSWFGRLSTTLIFGVATAVGTVIYVAYFNEQTIPVFSSQDRRERLLARTELAVAGLLIYGSFSWLYADVFYANVPPVLGGGRPSHVIAEISIPNSQIDLSAALPNAQCSCQGTSWRCENLYLVDAHGENWVVADTPESRGDAIVIPKAEFALIQGH
jgi:hypothetical protein